MISQSFWQNKKVLVTGHTGFKGSWLTLWLNLLGAKVTGYALQPRTEKDNFVLTGLHQRVNSNFADIRDFPKLLNTPKRLLTSTLEVQLIYWSVAV